MNMEIKTYRASSMQEALRLVRTDLGPGAAVLHTREAPLSRILGWLPGVRRIEVTASTDVIVPNRFPLLDDEQVLPGAALTEGTRRAAMPGDLAHQINELQAMVEDLCRRSRGNSAPDLPDSLFSLYAELLDCEMP
jgi:flagellar biosynthesis protein FlhF